MDTDKAWKSAVKKYGDGRSIADPAHKDFEILDIITRMALGGMPVLTGEWNERSKTYCKMSHSGLISNKHIKKQPRKKDF